MSSSVFSRLRQALPDAAAFASAYDTDVRALVSRPLWANGNVADQRVLWTDGRRAREHDVATFAKPGLYMWGCEERPLYIGKTEASFKKRFGRYLWNEKSQCNLARDYEAALRADGISGFPPEIHAWYATYTPSKVRLEGAARFATEGLSNVWFAPFPADESAAIKSLERALVPVADLWNRARGIGCLLNDHFTS